MTKPPDYRTRSGREAEISAELSIGPISPEWLDAIPQRRAAWNRMVRDGRIAAPIAADSLAVRAVTGPRDNANPPGAFGRQHQGESEC